MRSFASFVLAAVVATAAAGCGGDSSSSEPAASRADSRAPTATAPTESPASPGQSPTASPPKAAKSAKPTESATPATAVNDDKPATRQVLGLPAGWELAPRADYTAKQAGGQVTVTAKGESPTAGYQVKLFESPLRIWPPQWMLAHKKPDGMAAQVITPFEVSASFKSDRKVATVVVNDAAGRRTVSVAQAEK